MTSWSAWHLDPPTWAWIVWIAWFFLVETWALITPAPLDTLTAHLRPLFVSHPLTWYLALGLWLWIGQHFLVEGVFAPATGTG